MKEIIQRELMAIFGSTQEISLPVGAEIISVDNGVLSALGNESLPGETRHIVIVRPGDSLISSSFKYIGTTIFNGEGDPSFVFESPFNF